MLCVRIFLKTLNLNCFIFFFCPLGAKETDYSYVTETLNNIAFILIVKYLNC